MNALANASVGQYLNEYFVSTYQKVATFRINGDQKQGGNVASYFCTPEGRVLHVLAGPVNADQLLREARWAVESYKMARLECREDATRLRMFLWKVHGERLRQEYGLDLTADNAWPSRDLGKQGRVHLLLTAAPLARLENIYTLVFEKILNEKVSTAPVVQN